MTKDRNKGITNIVYNHLNLPTKVVFGSNANMIKYRYDAIGTKLQKEVIDNGNSIITKYANGFIYEEDELQFFSQPEGYVQNNNGTFSYVYSYLDHLGNIRLNYSDLDNNGSIDSNTEILDEKNYYPGGLVHQGYNTGINGTYHPYGFNGKEENNELDLNTLDFGARNYDPALMRWMNLDPLAEQMRRHSPYNFAFNNPILFIDPDGMAPLNIYELNKGTGEITLKEVNDDKTDTLVDSDGGDTVSENVDKGLLNDGQNIRKNGLQTSNVKGGGNLVVDISMHTNEEVVTVVYKNEEGSTYLEVRPSDKNSVERNKDGKVTTMSSGTSQEIKSSFTSSDGTFTGKPIYSIHTHPGHPDGVESIGDPDPSNDDVRIAIDNKKINNVDIYYYIIGAKKSSKWGKASNRTRYSANGKVTTVDPPKKK